MSEEIIMKTCHTCDKEFPATKEFFVTGKGHKDGLRYLCKKCRRDSRRKTVPIPDGFRKCGKCKEIHPATHDFFPYHRRNEEDKLDCYCYSCRKDIYQEQAKKEQETPSTTYMCKDCEEEKPFTEEYFPKNPTMRYGLMKKCKRCTQDQQTQLRHMNPQKHNAYMKMRYHKDVEVSRAKNRNWYEKSKENRRRLEKLRRLANPETFKANSRRYRQTEKGRLISRIHARNRQIRKKGIPGYYTPEDIKQKYKVQKGCCYYCDKKFKKGKNAYHIEHVIPITRPGATNWPDNIVLACPTCNHSKYNKLPHEWPQGGRLLESKSEYIYESRLL